MVSQGVGLGVKRHGARNDLEMRNYAHKLRTDRTRSTATLQCATYSSDTQFYIPPLSCKSQPWAPAPGPDRSFTRPAPLALDDEYRMRAGL